MKFQLDKPKFLLVEMQFTRIHLATLNVVTFFREGNYQNDRRFSFPNPAISSSHHCDSVANSFILQSTSKQLQDSCALSRKSADGSGSNREFVGKTEGVIADALRKLTFGGAECALHSSVL